MRRGYIHPTGRSRPGPIPQSKPLATHKEQPPARGDEAVEGHVEAVLDGQLLIVQVLARVGDERQAEHLLADVEAEPVEEFAHCGIWGVIRQD